MSRTELINELLKQAEDTGFLEAEAYYERSDSFKCMIFKGEVDNYETSEEAGIGFRGLFNGKMGYAYTEKIDESSIAFLVESAKVNADILDESDDSSIFEGSKEYAQHSFYNPDLKKIGIPDKIELIKAIEEKVLAYDPRITTLNYCMLQDFNLERVMTNSKGLSLQDERNGIYIFISAVVKAEDEMKTGQVIKMSRDFHSFNAEVIATELAKEALSYLGGKSIPSGKYPVIFRHDASASLLAVFSDIFSAENTQKDQSLLKGKVGGKIGSDLLTLVDDPFHPDAFSGSTFDGEGVATKKRTIISNGTLETILHNRKTAEVDGCESTGNAFKPSYKGSLTIAPQNLYIAPGEQTKEQLISNITDGVLITHLSGLHSGTNTISGDFSVEATGFHIKDGKIESPINQMTIASNFYQVMKTIEAIASDLTFQPGGYGSPSILVKELAVTVD